MAALQKLVHSVLLAQPQVRLTLLHTHVRLGRTPHTQGLQL